MQFTGSLRTNTAMRPSPTEEPRWQAAVAVLAAIGLYVTLPPKIVLGPLWLMPILVLAVLVPLLVISPRRHDESRVLRSMSIATVALVNAFNVGTVVLLCLQQLSSHHRKPISGEEMLLAAVQIWLTNIIVYALWFWEIDGRGPDVRDRTAFPQNARRADFLFPQMSLEPQVREVLKWRPAFIDYLFVAFTNATAFSPSDTFALTPRAKVLMMMESLTSLVTIAIIAARALSLLT
jgi:hypothetical protein